MLSTSVIYLVTCYQELTDESSTGFHEIIGDANEPTAQSDLDSHQWSEIDMAAKVQTIFFLAVGILYVPVGIWMIKSKDNTKPFVIAVGGSLSLIVLYELSRIMDLPLVGLQTDVGMIDIVSKALQGLIVTGCSYLVLTRRFEKNPSL